MACSKPFYNLVHEPGPKSMNTQYAGFWLRLVAIIIDAIIIGIVQSVIFVPILTAAGFGFATAASEMDTNDMESMMGMMAAFFAAIATYALLAKALQILYFTFMESSTLQATLGKLALGIKVTDMNGSKLDFGRAFVRNICKVISDCTLLIGYIMAGFTEKRQSLHDVIAGTLVVKK